MPAYIENPTKLIGKVFGRLTVIAFDSRRGKAGHFYWLCVCVCGTVKAISQSGLTSGRSTSCECYHYERITRRRSMRGHPLHKRWLGMIQRCTYPGDSSYKNYGARGITVCKRWRKFENWLADMGLPPSPLHTLERKDNNKGYTPSNTVWATVQEQNSNRRVSRRIKAFGKTQTIRAWSREKGLAPSTIRYRLEIGMVAEKALVTPPYPGKSTRRKP